MNLVFVFLLQFSIVWASSIDRPMSSGGDSISNATEGLYARRGELKPPPEIFDLEDQNRVFFSEFKQHGEELKKVKYYLLNGEIRLARVFLSKLTYAKTKLRPVVNRYQAILNFIEGNYDESYDLLRTKEMDSAPHYSKVCTLRVLNQIILNKTSNLKEQWDRCKNENYGYLAATNLLWLETLIEIKLNPRHGITKVPFRNLNLEGLGNEELKVFLKMALYLNQEEQIIKEIPLLSVDQLQDTDVRELVGQIYFRTGALANTYKYVEDLKSPNSENIKGNLYILRKKYELAYAQFKLALEMKYNSQNAMERLLPLAWILGDWEEGAKYAERVIASPQTLIHKMTLAAAFHVQKGSFQEAREILDNVTQKSRRGGELDVTQLYSFASLMQNFPQQVRRYANISCAKYDLTNCWLLFQLGQWDAFPVMIRRDDTIAHKKRWEKLAKEDLYDPLKENIYVNQLDIEELDDKLIKLIP
jgi:hypothetical protein